MRNISYLQVHLVWCTKYRYHVLTGEVSYGAWSVRNITEEVLEAYLTHHKEYPSGSENFMLE